MISSTFLLGAGDVLHGLEQFLGVGDGFLQGLQGLATLEHLLLQLVSQAMDLLAPGLEIGFKLSAQPLELFLSLPEVGRRVPDFFLQGRNPGFELGAQAAELPFLLPVLCR